MYRHCVIYIFCGLLVLPACLQRSDRTAQHVPILQELFMTPVEKGAGIDSIAVWHGPQGQHWLIATAKSAHALVVYDATNGERIAMIGQNGSKPGEFIRPNGIAIAGDLLFVVERDGKRMQVIELPTLRVCAMTAQDELTLPYGLAVAQQGNGKYSVYVTENAGIKGQRAPKKIYQYAIDYTKDNCTLKLVRIFGDTDGAGALWKVESIAVDPAHNRLFIADEHPERKDIKIYTLNGKFTGKIIGQGLIQSEPEGIAVYETDAQNGYIICTDQDKINNVFWLFDRVTLEPLGAVRGAVVRNTDGIACSPLSFGPFKHGAFYAVHDDGSIGAYDWQAVVQNFN